MSRPVWAYLALVLIVSIVNDGWSGRPSPLLHQELLLPFACAFAVSLWCCLRPAEEDSDRQAGRKERQLAVGLIFCLILFEALSVLSFWYEKRHFARFGYVLHLPALLAFLACLAVAAFWSFRSKSAPSVFGAILLAYGAGLLLAMRSFPLNYLRSDMLPVIVWADQRIVSHANPYGTMHIGTRIYDFPYLPGMLVAFLPAVLAHIDVRFITLVCLVSVAVLIYANAGQRSRMAAACLLGLFLLSPFLQYRHDLYLAPHWLALTGAVTLMQRRHFAWAAAVFGVSMALYQLSWVLFPFLLLNGLRRAGIREALKQAALGLVGMLVVIGPFLRSAAARIASNTVGQWSQLPHALADPINLSYWLTFLVRPDQLKWVQFAVLTAIFGFCVLRDRCANLTDTLRWMGLALAVFIALNVIVDGYFYLTLLLLLLMYTCAVTGVWPDFEAPALENAGMQGIL